MSSAPSMRWSRTLTVFELSAPSVGSFGLTDGIFVGSRPWFLGDRDDGSGHARRGKSVSQRLVRKWTDGQGKRQKPFADLCLTTWLRRRIIQGLNLQGQGLVENPRTATSKVAHDPQSSE